MVAEQANAPSTSVFPSFMAHCFPGAEGEPVTHFGQWNTGRAIMPLPGDPPHSLSFFWFCSDQVEGSEFLKGKGATGSLSP